MSSEFFGTFNQKSWKISKKKSESFSQFVNLESVRSISTLTIADFLRSRSYWNSWLASQAKLAAFPIGITWEFNQEFQCLLLHRKSEIVRVDLERADSRIVKNFQSFFFIFFNLFGWRSWRILKTSDFSDWKIPIGKADDFACDANRTLSYISLQFQGNFFEWGVFKSKQRVHSGTPELKKSWWGKAFQCCKRNLKSALNGIV